MLESLTQQSHPRLWLAFQGLFGATRDKQRIALSFLPGKKNVLEVGCSLGVVSAAFRGHRSVRYLGIDIDEQAIRHAQSRFGSYSHMAFAAKSLETLVAEGHRFDYVLFANILHHVDDALAKVLLKQAVSAVADGGIIVLMEPDILHPEDGLLVRSLYRLERGEYRRPMHALKALAEEAGIALMHTRKEGISIGLLPGVVGGNMLVLAGSVQ